MPNTPLHALPGAPPQLSAAFQRTLPQPSHPTPPRPACRPEPKPGEGGLYTVKIADYGLSTTVAARRTHALRNRMPSLKVLAEEGSLDWDAILDDTKPPAKAAAGCAARARRRGCPLARASARAPHASLLG